MEINLFAETYTRAEILKRGGTWIECLNQTSDGVVYLPINEPEDLLILQNIQPTKGEEL